MARSKNFFGLRRGSTKSHTFSVLHGEQITKDRVYDIANPQTPAQMRNRLTFAAVSLFYKHATRNLFKFAYEDKKNNESEYNAFMRHNVGRGAAVSKLMIDNDYPAMGNWLVSNGRLGTYQPVYKHDIDNPAMAFENVLSKMIKESDVRKISIISRNLLANNSELQEGDIVTIVRIFNKLTTPLTEMATAMKAESLVETTANNAYPTWQISQFILDTTNEEEVPDQALVMMQFGDEADAPYYLAVSTPAGISMGESETQPLFGCALIVSRVAKGSVVYVSRSIVGANLTTQASIELGISDEWKSWAAQNYVSVSSKFIPDAILKGSIVEEKKSL